MLILTDAYSSLVGWTTHFGSLDSKTDLLLFARHLNFPTMSYFRNGDTQEDTFCLTLIHLINGS